MNKIHVAAIIIIAVSLILLASTQLLQKPGGEFFVVDVLRERFVIQVTDSETIRLAKENPEGKNSVFPSGQLARGDGGFNQPWSWHLKPDTVRMVEVSMELCDGTPSFVEADLDYWVDTVKSYCPWAGQIIASGRDSGMEAPIKLTITLDKASYAKGDRMIITVSNPSSKRLVFSNSVYSLFFEARIGDGWKYYDAVIGNEVITFLESGEQATIRYMLGQSRESSFDPGEYRVVLMGTVEGEKRSVTASAIFTVS